MTDAELCFEKDLRPGWYPIALSAELRRPRRVTFLDKTLALWRGAAGVHALEDRCLHRQAPLSAGQVAGDRIRCPYHGWEYTGEGRCALIPAEPGPPAITARLPAYSVRERGGFVWLAVRASGEPPALSWPGGAPVLLSAVLPASLIDCAENFLDPQHTPFVHPGLVRASGAARRREVTVELGAEAIVARHAPIEEGIGPLSSLFRFFRARVSHSDRFTLPNRIDVDYHIEAFGGLDFAARLALAPRGPRETFLALSLELRGGRALRLLGPLIRAYLRRAAGTVLRQDRAILKLVTENRARFGDPPDLFPASDYVHRQLRRLWQGQPLPEARSRSFEMRV